MNIDTVILAIDPGNEKTGMAILSSAGELLSRTIVETQHIASKIESLITDNFTMTHIVCGNGTNHKHIYPTVQQIGRNHKITTSLIDESHSTEEARKLYWSYNPPKGWRKLIPTSMQFPPEPVDDLTAYVIGMRYTKQLQAHTQTVKDDVDTDTLASKRLAAIKRLYNEGDTHE